LRNQRLLNLKAFLSLYKGPFGHERKERKKKRKEKKKSGTIISFDSLIPKKEISKVPLTLVLE
jgi:hypothetical protein